MVTIRGATTVNEDNSKKILTATKELLEQIITKNNLDSKKIISIFFSCTKDLKSIYPAKAAREMGFTNISLMCFQEMYVEESLEKCIRTIIFYDCILEQNSLKHIYLNKAIDLRPDLNM